MPAEREECRAGGKDEPSTDRGYDEATQRGPAYAGDEYGEIVPADDGVDGDYNGAPDLAGVEESERWEGVDALDAMRGRDIDEQNATPNAPHPIGFRALLEERQRGIEERLAALGDVPALPQEEPPQPAEEPVLAPASPPAAEEEGAAAPEKGDPLFDPDAIDAQLHRELDAVDAALERIEERDYGCCIRCGAQIVRDRLLAEPETPFCEACAREVEIG
jgi:hypothetical protein